MLSGFYCENSYFLRVCRMKRYAKDPIREALEQAKVESSGESAVDLVDLLEKTKAILQREVQNLLAMSLEGKLKVRESESLVQYTKLLNQLVKDEEKKANEQ
jgi:hypothetical protein